MSTRSELGESPRVVEAILGDARGQIAAVASAFRSRSIDLVVIAARGTSDHAALYGQYVLGARNRLLVAPAAPSLVSLYGAPPRLRNALVIGISQSGQSPDVVAYVADSRNQGALTVAVTNDANSDLAAAAELVVELCADPEVAVAATKTYVAEVAVLAVLSSMLSADPASRDELRIIPSALRIALAREAEIARVAEHWAGEDRCVVIARGFQYATAREWALKLKELANVLADPYSAADFQHGPIALVREGFPVLAVATSGAALNGMAELLGRLRVAKARLLVLTDDDSLAEGSDDLRVPPVPEWLAPLVAIVPAQLFAYHLSRARGLDTETPPNITKVTRTL